MKRTILITGGTGFLGKQFARRLSQDYTVLLGNFDLQTPDNIEREFELLDLDVTSIQSVRNACRKARPSIVIHAAGTKYVEMAERQPCECIDLNVAGSENVAKVAIETNVDAVIGLSTVIAAPPVRNTYGLTKALMERMFCALSGKSHTKFVCLRYGNVAWSTGSVLDVWKRMFENTGLIQTTGPHMTRFFLTVDEAFELALLAISQIDHVHGKVLTRAMKVAQIGDILDVWTEMYGGRWTRIAGRLGEGVDEYAVGQPELPHTEKCNCDKFSYYTIAYNQISSNPLVDVVSSATASHFSSEEIKQILMNRPSE
jgi:UDP-N-acetylglucosamine 4,6-dehydratase/5-epimerase